MSASTAVVVRRLFADPHQLLHSLDFDRARAVFLTVSEARIREASFIDGRTPIASAPEFVLPFGDILSAAPNQARAPRRYVFHMSFCGSTLLARMLDSAGHTIALKEPNCLVDLANWQSALRRSGKSDDRFDRMLTAAEALLARPWPGGEVSIVKPSSWANSLLAPMGRTAAVAMIPLFVTITRKAFLRAVFRGGTERLRFTGRLAAHLALHVPGGETLIASAIAASSEPFAQAANLAAAAHHTQLQLFAAAIAAGRWSGRNLVRFDDLMQRPVDVAADAAGVLQLELPRSRLEANVERWSGTNAKGAGTFSSDRHRRADDQVMRRFGAAIDGACEWATATVGPEPIGAL